MTEEDTFNALRKWTFSEVLEQWLTQHATAACHSISPARRWEEFDLRSKSGWSWKEFSDEFNAYYEKINDSD